MKNLEFHISLRISFCLHFLLLQSFVFGQFELLIDHLGSEDGLTSQLCQKMTADKYGNLWISSFQDVQMYDGYTVTSFPISTMDNKQIGVIKLIPDAQGNIWVIQGEYDFKLYNNHFTKSFLKYKITVINPKTQEVKSLKTYLNTDLLDLNDIKNIQSFGEKIYIISNENKIFTFIDSINLFAKVKDSNAFILLNKQEKIIKVSSNKIEIQNRSLQLDNLIDSVTISNYDTFLVTDQGQIFFLEQTNGLVRIIEYENGNCNPILQLPQDRFSKFLPKKTQGKTIIHTSIQKYNDEYILVNGQMFKIIESSLRNQNKSINGRYIYDCLINENGLIYIATNLGIYIFDNNKKIFRTLASGSPEQNSVRDIFVNDKIKAYKIPKKEVLTNITNDYDLSFLKSHSLGSIAMMHYQDPLDNDVLWSCGYVPKRLRKINFRVKEILNEFKFEHPFFANGIHRSSITHKLYLSSDIGLLQLDEAKNQIERVSLDCFNGQDMEIHQIIERNNELWIASPLGVVRYNEQTHNCTLDSIFTESLKCSIQFIHIDNIDRDIVWLGTKRKGLIRWNTMQNSIESYNASNGLSNNDVHAIIEDSNNQLWMSTNRYLNCLDKKSNDISIFTEEDGLSHSEFNRYSYHFDTITNEIYFGGLDGYTYFNPDSISSTTNNKRIQLRILNATKTMSDGTVINITEELDSKDPLKFSEDDISFEVALSTDHLANTNKIHYSYRIPGLYENWKSQSSNHLTFSRLPYGDHTLQFVSDLNKPAYTSDLLSLEICVLKPIYKKWYGILIVASTVFLFTWFLIQQYLKTIKTRNARLEETISKRTKELRELNDLKTKIFAILAHDLRNPISSLVNIAEKTKFLARHNRLDEIDLLADRSNKKINALNDNLNNILLWAISESKMLTQYPEKLSLRLEIEKILNLYSSDIDMKKLKMYIELEDIDQVFLDITILQTVLRNVISNAIKFSFDGGLVSFIKRKETRDRMILDIIDEGIGFSGDKSTIQKAEMKGSGIGLRISKELAIQSDIILTTKSHSNCGTTITLDMPKMK